MRGLDIVRIKRPAFVMMFAAMIIFGVALAASSIINSNERPIVTGASTLPSKAQ